MNRRPCARLKALADSLKDNDGKVMWREVLTASSMRSKAMQQWDGFSNGICRKYACGECRNRQCQAAHLACDECPKEWVRQLAEKLERAREQVRRNARGGADDGVDLR